MFASLLPGLREVRTPLAAGFIWLSGLWLSLRNILKQFDQSAGIGRDIVTFADWAGKPVTFAIVTFVAYLAGTLSVAATNILNVVSGRITYFIGRGHLEWLKPALWAFKGEEGALRNAVANRLARRFLEDQPFRDRAIEHVMGLQEAHARQGSTSRLPRVLASMPGEHAKQLAMESYRIRTDLLLSIIDTEPFVDIARRDLEYAAPRLLGKEDVVYGEYDRLSAEGSFRVNLFLPMCYLFGTLAFIVSPWWITGFMAPIALVYLGSHSLSLARRHLVVALAAERVESPGLDRIINGPIEFTQLQDLAIKK